MNHLKKISVIMACYNAESFIRNAIQSILNQTYPDFEFVIVDDASTDGTRNIIKTFCEKDPRIVFHSQEINTGPTAARNVALQMSKGKWAAIMDADDIALPFRLEKQLAHVESRPETVLLGTACILVDMAEGRIKEHRYSSRHGVLERSLKRMQKFPPHSSCLFNNDLAKKIGGYNPKFPRAAEWDLWLRLSELGNLACLDEPLVKIRKHSKQISHQENGKQQVLMVMAACVCHYLRGKGGPDPSMEGEQEWDEFINWLEFQLEKEGIFAMMESWSELRKRWFEAVTKRMQRLELLARFIRCHYRIGILGHKLLGTARPATYAEEWLIRQRAFAG